MRAILSDVGGVLVEEPWGLAAARLLPHDPVAAARLAAQFRAHSPELDLGRLDLEGLYAATPVLAERAVSREEFLRVARDESLQPVAENIEFLRELGGTHRLGLIAVTNVGPEIAQALDHKLRLGELFDAVVRSWEIGRLKPDPLFFAAAVARAGVPRSACLYVDDNVGYVRAAEALGIPSVHVAIPGALRERVREALEG